LGILKYINITKNKRAYVQCIKGKTIPVQVCYKPGGFQDVEAPRFRDSRHMKVVRLPFTSWEIFLVHILLEAESTPGPDLLWALNDLYEGHSVCHTFWFKKRNMTFLSKVWWQIYHEPKVKGSSNLTSFISSYCKLRKSCGI